MTRATHTRPGVTLIEMLVVIGIIGILVALTAAALQKTSERQTVKSSTDQVFKLQQALDLEYERVVQKCAADANNGGAGIPQPVKEYCDNNLARAKAVWTALQLRLHFPETFAEAASSVSLMDGSNNVYYVAKPKETFRDVWPLAGGTFPNANEESGALLYLILAKQSVSGGGAMATAADDLSQAMKTKVTLTNGTVTKELETFADAWKNPVGFHRWAYYDATRSPALAELEDPTKGYFDPKLVTGTNRDPLDPQGLVLGWSDAGKRTQMGQTLLFIGKVRVVNVYAVGKNKTLDLLAPSNDDIYGFRTRRQGAQGTSQ